MGACFVTADILLPEESVDLTKWAVNACDQYTSQPDYWERVEEIVGDQPSAYKIILPEVYLEEKEVRMKDIRKQMEAYTKDGVLKEVVHQGFVLVERKVPGGIRLGLVGAVDLEQYDFRPDTRLPIHATEGTILSRIPPRVVIRKSASVESPHIMMLVADKEGEMIETLYQEKEKLRQLYDFELMLDGGHLRGYAVEGELAQSLLETITHKQSENDGVFLAVGDGNHSLAAAKTYWNELKTELSPEEKEVHPARFALAELVNLYSPALVFEPIHRGVITTDARSLFAEFETYVKDLQMEISDGHDLVFLDKQGEKKVGLSGLKGRLPIDILQRFLDQCISDNAVESVDYIHGEENVRMLAEETEGFVGILTQTIEKESLFSAIEAGGVLPRKTFSMGEAEEKRYYLECRELI